MKTLLLFFVLFVGTLPGVAQVESGNKFVNGTANLTLIGNGEDTQSAIAFSPRLGYFFNDRTAVGGAVGIFSQSAGDSDGNLTVSLSPFVRRFFPIVDEQFYFFLNGSLSLSYGNSAAGFGEFSSSEDAFSVSLVVSPGFVYFPAERWSLDLAFTGFGLSFFDIGENTVTLFNLGVTTFSPSLGFSYYF